MSDDNNNESDLNIYNDNSLNSKDLLGNLDNGKENQNDMKYNNNNNNNDNNGNDKNNNNNNNQPNLNRSNISEPNPSNDSAAEPIMSIRKYERYNALFS